MMSGTLLEEPVATDESPSTEVSHGPDLSRLEDHTPLYLRTSRAVAVPSLTIKLPCSRDTTAPPTRAPFNPSSSISRPAGIEGGFLNAQPALGAAGCDAHRFWLNALIRCAMDSGESGRPLNTAPSAM